MTRAGRRVTALGRPAPRPRPVRSRRNPLSRWLSVVRPDTSGGRTCAEVLAALAPELAAGRAPRPALLAAAAPVPDACPAAQQAARSGGDVAAALRVDAAASGVRWWAALAACWEVAESSGVPPAVAVARLAGAARADTRLRAEVRAELAAARATGVLLAMLPLVGFPLGSALGADPASWLVTTGPGRLVLVAGLALQAAGWWWLRSMTRAAQERAG